MAELAGLAVGVVSLGIQVSGGITEYVDALNCRHQDLSSLIQKNDSLRKTLQIVEKSLSRLHHEHQDAGSAVRESLNSCKNELTTLKRLVDSFTYDSSTTSRKTKIKNTGKKLLYPFNRPQLDKLEARLGYANSALQLALEALGLSVSQLSTEKLTTLEATSRNISTDVLDVQSKISALNTPLKDIHSTLSGFETRFGDYENQIQQLVQQLLVQPPAINERSQEITPAVATGRLLAKPGVLKDICDVTGTKARPNSSGTLSTTSQDATEIGGAAPMYFGGRFSCLCRHRRRLQRKNLAWGFFTASLETATEEHLPGCRAADAITNTDRSRKISLTYTGFRRLLNSAIQLSFAIPSGAGAWSLAPNLTYYPTVDEKTAPAFKMLSLATSSGGTLLSWAERKKLIALLVSAIFRLFRTKKASPREVNAKNESLVTHVLLLLINYIGGASEFSRNLVEPCPPFDLLEYLLANKAPANDYDLSGSTPLCLMFETLSYCEVTNTRYGAAADLILRSNIEDNVLHLKNPFPPLETVIVDSARQMSAKGTVAVFHFLARSTKIAEAFGCGPLSLAILSHSPNKLRQVEHLVRNHPSTLFERNVFGHTPLHLAADKPECLRILVKAVDARILNQVDAGSCEIDEYSAVELALKLSGMLCREPDPDRMCRRCKCAECTVILMGADDCALPVPAHLSLIFSYASKRCKLRYIRQMKARRDKLKQLALENLPITEVEQLDLSSERVLDAHAARVIQLLQHEGVRVPEALAATRNGSSSVHEALSDYYDAKLFFRVGFYDTDSWFNLEATAEFFLRDWRRKPLTHLYWLAMHGAASCLPKSIGSGDTSKTQLIFWTIGEDLSCIAPRPRSLIPWIHDLNDAALSANIVDGCRCECSPEGCSPITSMLKALIGKNPYGLVAVPPASANPSKMITKFREYLTLFWGDLGVRPHTAALRYLTYSALCLPHRCCTPNSKNWPLGSECRIEIEGNDPSSKHLRRLLGIDYDHSYKRELLEELLVEFEEELIPMIEDPDRGYTDLDNFWNQTWVNRMKEVYKILGRKLTDEEMRGAEEIGVVWNDPKPEPPKVVENPFREDTLDHWVYELEKIESACY
ncbi:hypothetical protein FQN54_004450 [Arachnomyces sp. PD_36]|nr:hypothetical protein FQN54_004450 [Arachnomyces sp. PD_36]